MHVLQSLSLIGVLAISAAAAAVPDDPHNVTPIDVNSAAPKFVAKEVDGRAFEYPQATVALRELAPDGPAVVQGLKLWCDDFDEPVDEDAHTRRKLAAPRIRPRSAWGRVDARATPPRAYPRRGAQRIEVSGGMSI